MEEETLEEAECHHHYSDCCQVTASADELITAKETVELRERTWAHLLLVPVLLVAKLHCVVAGFSSRESLVEDDEYVCPVVYQEEEVMEEFAHPSLAQNYHRPL